MHLPAAFSNPYFVAVAYDSTLQPKHNLSAHTRQNQPPIQLQHLDIPVPAHSNNTIGFENCTESVVGPPRIFESAWRCVIDFIFVSTSLPNASKILFAVSDKVSGDSRAMLRPGKSDRWERITYTLRHAITFKFLPKNTCSPSSPYLTTANMESRHSVSNGAKEITAIVVDSSLSFIVQYSK